MKLTGEIRAAIALSDVPLPLCVHVELAPRLVRSILEYRMGSAQRTAHESTS